MLLAALVANSLNIVSAEAALNFTLGGRGESQEADGNKSFRKLVEMGSSENTSWRGFSLVEEQRGEEECSACELGGSLRVSGGTEKKSGCEAAHTDDLAATALRQLFIRPLKEHNQDACVAFCSTRVFFPLCSGLCASERRSRKRVSE